MRNAQLSYTGNSDSGVKNALTYFLVGGGIGAAFALLFAPKAGSELRGDIADVTKRGINAAREKTNQLHSHSAEAIGKLREKADGIYQYASNHLGKSQEALDLATFETAMVEENVRELADRPDAASAAKPTARKASSIM